LNVRKAKWGDPVAKIRIGYHSHDLKVGEYLAQRAEELLKKMGTKDIASGISGSPPPNLVGADAVLVKIRLRLCSMPIARHTKSIIFMSRTEALCQPAGALLTHGPSTPMLSGCRQNTGKDETGMNFLKAKGMARLKLLDIFGQQIFNIDIDVFFSLDQIVSYFSAKLR